MSAPRILILGGARSGKSDYAEKLAAEKGQRVLYIATAEADDEEMAARIAHHRQTRPDYWQTLEAPRQVGAALEDFLENSTKSSTERSTWRPEVLLLDCLTLLVSNVLIALEGEPLATIEAAVQREIETLLVAQTQLAVPLIVVSNEVGLGIVPPSVLGRLYRDVLGRANQQLAAQADQVFLMVAGLPMVVK